ncbi:hypothetical protein [Dinoroseobacter sp. S76]|uniref:hypothetical protein n=1 Tax=Dinoroseobacter sp. S76 TaxID=3415124 RepID=UPI003C7B5636
MITLVEVKDTTTIEQNLIDDLKCEMTQRQPSRRELLRLSAHLAAFGIVVPPALLTARPASAADLTVLVTVFASLLELVKYLVENTNVFGPREEVGSEVDVMVPNEGTFTGTITYSLKDGSEIIDQTTSQAVELEGMKRYRVKHSGRGLETPRVDTGELDVKIEANSGRDSRDAELIVIG